MENVFPAARGEAKVKLKMLLKRTGQKTGSVAECMGQQPPKTRGRRASHQDISEEGRRVLEPWELELCSQGADLWKILPPDKVRSLQRAPTDLSDEGPGLSWSHDTLKLLCELCHAPDSCFPSFSTGP